MGAIIVSIPEDKPPQNDITENIPEDKEATNSEIHIVTPEKAIPQVHVVMPAKPQPVFKPEPMAPWLSLLNSPQAAVLQDLPHPAAPILPEPAAQVSTVFESGSKPGEYSTRITTIVVGRKKRDIEPTPALKIQPVKPTKQPSLQEVQDKTHEEESLLEELQSSLISELYNFANKFVPVTVTVTETKNLCTPTLP